MRSWPTRPPWSRTAAPACERAFSARSTIFTGALAVTPATRSQILPDVPTIGESAPGYVGGGWSGIGAPAGTPREIIDLLNREVNAALADPRIKGRIENLGSPVLMMSPTEFRKLIAEESERWAKVIKFAKIKPE